MSVSFDYANIEVPADATLPGMSSSGIAISDAIDIRACRSDSNDPEPDVR
jgi:hypothetical protein